MASVKLIFEGFVNLEVGIKISFQKVNLFLFFSELHSNHKQDLGLKCSAWKRLWSWLYFGKSTDSPWPGV